MLNLQTNEVPNVEALNYGVADADRFIDFTPSQDSLGDNIFEASNAAGSENRTTQKVELVSLESLLQRHGKGLEKYDLLKLDCEGAEYPILKSTPLELLKKFHSILIEFHPEPYAGALNEAYERLIGMGYSSRRGRPGKPNFVDLFYRN